jgi:hypothetical protein
MDQLGDGFAAAAFAMEPFSMNVGVEHKAVRGLWRTIAIVALVVFGMAPHAHAAGLQSSTDSQSSSAAPNGDENIVWGTAVDENIVWGTDCGGANLDNIVWGTFDDAGNIVWSTPLADENIVWGTASDDENIVWGTRVENIVWGTVVENIVWGTVVENIVWGTFTGAACGDLGSQGR